MAKSTRVRVVKFKVTPGPVLRRTQRAQRRASVELAKLMTDRLFKVLSRQGTPKNRSKPGQHPKKQTGYLQYSTKVTAKGRTMEIRTPQYGIWLEGGTSRMLPRPFLRRNIHDKQAIWNKKWKTLMRRFAK